MLMREKTEDFMVFQSMVSIMFIFAPSCESNALFRLLAAMDLFSAANESAIIRNCHFSIGEKFIMSV